MNKKSFVFFGEWLEAISRYPQGQREALYDAICVYAITGEELALPDPGHQALFSLFKTRIDQNNVKYEQVCERNKKNIGKRWAKKKAQEAAPEVVPDDTNAVPDDTNGYESDTKKYDSYTKSYHSYTTRIPDDTKPVPNALDTDSDTDTEKKKKEESLRSSSFCAEVEKPTSSPNVESVHIADTDLLPFEQPVVRLPLVDGTAASFMQAEVDHWQELYPACDVMGELRKMQGWLESNPKNRKTARGIKRFITGWLSRAQDRARPVQQQYKPQQRPSADMAEALLNATGGDPYAFLSNRGYAAGPDGSELSQEHDAGRASAPLQGLGQHAGGY